MIAPTRKLELDVVSGGEVRDRLRLGQGDRNGMRLVVNLTEDGLPFDCTGYTPYLMIPIGRRRYRQEGEVNGDVATFLVDASRLGDFVGTVGGAYVSLEAGGEAVTSTQRFSVEVTRSLSRRRDAIPSEDEPVATGTLRIGGSVDRYDELPTLAAGDAGVVYDVAESHDGHLAGTNWVWTGERWDALSGSLDMTGLVTTAELGDLSNIVRDPHYTHTDNNLTAERARRIDGIARITNTVLDTILK